MKTEVDFAAILADCTLPAGLGVNLFNDAGQFWLQIYSYDKDSQTGTDMYLTGRKWRLSPHMTDGEVVRTLFAAVMAWTEHEVRETFKWRQRAIFSPHLSLYRLWGIADAVEKRVEPVAERVEPEPVANERLLYSDIKAGDVLVGDGTMVCLTKGKEYQVRENTRGELEVRCEKNDYAWHLLPSTLINIYGLRKKDTR